MTTTKHFSEYKKYQTSMSFGGCHFAVKGDTAAATCPCGWVHEFPSNPGVNSTVIELCTAHLEAHEAAAKQVAAEVGERMIVTCASAGQYFATCDTCGKEREYYTQEEAQRYADRHNMKGCES